MKEIHRRKATGAPFSSTTADQGHDGLEQQQQLQQGGHQSPLSPPSSSAPSNKARRLKMKSLLYTLAWTTAVIAMACLLISALFSSSHPNSSNDQVAPPANSKIPVSDLDSGATTTTTVRKTSEQVEYHVIFSTGCTTIQDWQSYVFFYYAMISQQPGTITRIASGCSEQDQVKLQTFFDEKIATMQPPGKFRIHFTPDYSRIKPGVWYKYFNKPYGTRHWLEHALGFPNNPVNEDAIVILMDPDQIILRPFRNNDFSNTKWTALKPGQVPRTSVEHGKPMAQRYGFGLQWKHQIDVRKLLGEGVHDSPLLHLSQVDANSGYVVGPPYIATARDMYKIASQWSEFAVPVHDQYPELLAEMYAYCHAAAHVGLPHQTAASFMVSDVGMDKDEGWSYIDPIPAEQVCSEHLDPEQLPNVFHYCQRYGLGKWMFGKFRLPNEFLSCEHPLMKEPPQNLATLYNYTDYPDGIHHDWSFQHARRNAFGTCVMLRAVNAAATHYKRHHCAAEVANYNKNLVYQ